MAGRMCYPSEATIKGIDTGRNVFVTVTARDRDRTPLGIGARLFAGGLGGLFAVITKYLGQDHRIVEDLIKAGTYLPLEDYVLAYAIFTPLLVILGAGVAWAADDEGSRMKLLALGVAAPALITTWSGASSLGAVGAATKARAPAAIVAPADDPSPPSALRLVSFHAVAADSGDEVWPEVQRESPLVRAFKRFFNIYETRYWVIVASLPTRESAALFADSIRRYPPTRQTYVGISGAWTGQWPVFAAPGETLEAARRRLDAVRRVPAIARNDPFIFAY